MPARTDLKKILILGSGPIVIGQACEFDYSGTQGVRALREEGYEICLVNSNPATIMTDPSLAERTYVEPLVPEVVEAIIERERPSAILPTLGGQTALNLAVALAERGVLEKYGVELLGAKIATIEMAEDRHKFKQAMARIGLATPRSGFAHSLDEARAVLAEVGLPAIIRASFTLGGLGGSVVYRAEDFDERVLYGISCSPRGQVLIEQSVLGWKEYELEVMRDRRDNVVVVCSIENLDPMGVHTGDSITVAPAMTLTDKEYQRMRDAAAAILREVGVETGGSNVQFAINPANGDMVIVEMNPRVSRSSALASKATGFPIAKIAAKLAVGYTLDELRNDITRTTPASFEPALDYVVVKLPRFAFEKFPGADTTLTTAMKSVGEVMTMGRTFREALQKAVRGLEIGRVGLEEIAGPTDDELLQRIAIPTPERLFELCELLRRGVAPSTIAAKSAVDPWFLAELLALVQHEAKLRGRALHSLTAEDMWAAKMDGFSDPRLAQLLASTNTADVRAHRKSLGVLPSYRRVDTCAAEFEAHTPYLYSSYERAPRLVPVNGVLGTAVPEAPPSDRKKVIILGGGPNRIGQGIEFDYCCVHAVFALQEDGYEVILINCNPETVSTDYDTADRLYFEPLTLEDVLNIVEIEKPFGVIVQFGGQTPLRLAEGLGKAGVPLLGTSADAIDRAEDRERSAQLFEKLGIQTPAFGTANTVDEAVAIGKRIGFPLMVRPSYVLGGRAMEVVHDLGELTAYVERAIKWRGEGDGKRGPLLLDRFLSDAIEVDIDAVSDGKRTIIGGVMEHIEEAGIHSGDSASVLPPYSLPAYIVETIEQQVRALAAELGVIGLCNAQFAVQGEDVYLLEVNPRASRTVPFVSKVTGNELAKLAARVMVGKTLTELGATEIVPRVVAIKAPVFPFPKLPGSDTILGPEMRSTGEVMGLDRYFGIAFWKAQLGAGVRLPTEGAIFISVRDADKAAALEVARRFHELGFVVTATHGTAKYFADRGVPADGINKVKEGSPHCVEAIGEGAIALIVNTTQGAQAVRDSFSIRRTALNRNVPCFTTISAARAAVRAIAMMKRSAPAGVTSLQEYHRGSRA